METPIAQRVPPTIYMIYIVLMSYAFDAGNVAMSEIAIIEMMAIVTPILPLLLIVAAISANSVQLLRTRVGRAD